MKTIAIIPAIVIASIVSSSAQTKFDRSYSTANYKQPNKAKIAADLNLDKSQVQAYNNKEGQEQFQNYKNAFAKADDNGGILPIFPVQIETGLASSANYKLQNRGARNPVKSIEQPGQQPLVLNLSE